MRSNENETWKQDVDRLVVTGEVLARSALGDLISFGGLLRDVHRQAPDDSEFKAWVEEHFGKAFARIAFRLENCHKTFSDKTELIPLCTPDALVAIVGDDTPSDSIMAIAEGGVVEVDGLTKKIQDLSLRDLSKIRARNKKLEELIQDKDLEIEALESELESLKIKIGNMGHSGLAEDIKKLQEIITAKENEILQLRERNHRNQRNEKKKTLVQIKSKLENFFLSEEMDLDAVIDALADDDKNLLLFALGSHEQQLRQFKTKLGITL